jgi:putative aldouronate transport system permease protein
MLVIRTYMNGIPDSLEESAQLDGAGYSTIFLKIYSPLCKPVYATVALFVAVGQWNSWFDAMLYNRMSSNLTTLQYELMKLLSSVTNQGTSAEAMKNAAGTVTPTSVRAAATIITMLPLSIWRPSHPLILPCMKLLPLMAQEDGIKSNTLPFRESNRPS